MQEGGHANGGGKATAAAENSAAAAKDSRSRRTVQPISSACLHGMQSRA
jgi:hypothetical protein